MQFDNDRIITLRKGNRMYTFLSTGIHDSVRVKMEDGTCHWTSVSNGRAIFKFLLDNGFKTSELLV